MYNRKTDIQKNSEWIKGCYTAVNGENTPIYVDLGSRMKAVIPTFKRHCGCLLLGKSEIRGRKM